MGAARGDAFGVGCAGNRPRAQRQVSIETKYAGYVRRQQSEVARQQRTLSAKIPPSFDFLAIPQLRKEAQEKLSRVRPLNLSQASRISGITPADLSVLMLYLADPERFAV